MSDTLFCGGFSVMKKICSGCGEMRDIERDFAWKNMAKGTRQRWCKFCQAEANRKHYQNNKQVYIEHAHEHHQNNRERYIDLARKRAINRHTENRQRLYEYLLTHPCVDCGQDDIRVLEFDHVRGGKKKSISRLLSIDAPWKAIQAEIEKCEVRCANCHRIKTNERGGFWRNLLTKFGSDSINKKKQLLLYEYLLTHPCVDCGQDDIRVLEFDHVRGNKIGNVAYMANNNSCSWLEIQAEIEKCEVRCANCHRIRTLDDRDSWRSLLS
ncbi:MAG: hypothetical protein ACR2H5_04790 [Ktedonobacteraceae bacterium]